MPRKTEVVIIGAGPTGLTLGVALRRLGVTCQIIEKEKEAPATSRALAIHARTLEILESMGVVSSFLKQGNSVHGMEMFINKKKSFTLSTDQIDTKYSYILVLPQSQTEHILEKEFVELGGVITRGATVRDFREEKEGVSVFFRTSDGEKKEVQGDFLVDCGGAHSLVRHTLAIPFKGKTYGDEDFLIADVKLDWDKETNHAYLFIQKEGVLAAFPLPEGRWRLVVEVHVNKEDNPPEPTLEVLQGLFVQRTGSTKTIVSDLAWASHFTINRRMITEYRRGRVFLAGDAAHIHSPFGGQGMNTGMQDAYNLAWKLAYSIKGYGEDILLDTYQRERVPVAQEVLGLTDVGTNIVASDNFFARFVRERLVGTIMNTRFVQRKMTSELAELTISYPKSSLSHILPQKRRLGAALHSGDRLPYGEFVDSKGKKVSTSHLVSGGVFVGFYCVSSQEELQKAIPQMKELEKEYSKGLVLYGITKRKSALSDSHILTAQESVFSQYDANPESFYLVRPDGYIAYCDSSFVASDIKLFFSAPFFASFM
jgi:2-polyprenyl-6-methoxyphenol hydroxylase-like FAD-dependent oxidoreductase